MEKNRVISSYLTQIEEELSDSPNSCKVKRPQPYRRIGNG
jgi:hypothetical protein